MKKAKLAALIYKWIVISVVIQVLMLVFINNVYLTGKNSFKITSLETAEPTPKPKAGIKVPSGVEQAKVSYDGMYTAYILDGKLEIVDIKNKKTIKTINPGKDSITYYKWLPDRDMIIYSLKSSKGSSGQVQIITYYIDSEVEHDYPKITNLPADSEITAIELSPLTNIVYTKIKTGNSQAKIYKFNIMDELSFVMNADINIKMELVNHSDILLYNDTENKLFMRDSKNSSKALPLKDKMSIIGVDAEDRYYAGKLGADNKVSDIYFGKTNVQTESELTHVPLKKPVPAKNIAVTSDGTIYEVEEAEKAVYNVQTNIKTSFGGKFMELIDGYVVSLENSELKFSPIKKK